MNPLRKRGVWGRLFFAGVASLLILVPVAFYYLGYGPSWLEWWAGTSMALIVIGFFGWLITFDFGRVSKPPPSN